MTNVIDNSTEHAEIWLLIPWYVNDRLDKGERQRVDMHLHTCTRCRDELVLQRSIYGAMGVGHGVEHMPQASLRRLQARLDQIEGGSATATPDGGAAADGGPATPVFASRPLPRRRVRWPAAIRPYSLVASVATLAIAAGIVTAVISTQMARRPALAGYFTVTDSSPRTPGVVVRAVFAPSITLAELQSLLGESKLRIVSGPTDAGVYSLMSTTTQPVSLSLSRLRGDPAVRFAESVQLGDPPR